MRKGLPGRYSTTPCGFAYYKSNRRKEADIRLAHPGSLPLLPAPMGGAVEMRSQNLSPEAMQQFEDTAM